MQDEPNQTDLYRSALGGYVARSDDGTKMKGLRPSEQPDCRGARGARGLA
jgi:hypothetical protein